MADIDALLKRLDAADNAPGEADVDVLLRRLDAIDGKTSKEVTYTANDGTQVVRMDDGRLMYTSPGWNTSNPEHVGRIMAGENPQDVARSVWVDQPTIDRAPFVARAQEVVRGVPFVGSYIDELAGTTKGEGAQANSRKLTSAMQRENPGETLALNMTGTVASTAPMAMIAAPKVAAMAPATRTGQVAAGAASGAALGAAEGATYQHGEGKSPAAGAAVGGSLGAVLGGLAPYASDAAGAVTRWFKSTDTSLIAKELGISAEAATVIRNAFRSGDRESAEQAIEVAGERAMLADAGQPARELLDSSAAAGGEAGSIARQAVDERAAVSSAELGKALDEALGIPVGQRTASSQIRSGSRDARSSAYNIAYAQPIDYSSGSGRFLERLVARVPKSAIDKANNLMRIGGEESTQMLARVGEDGTLALESLPDVRQLHYIMQALDDATESAKGVMGRNTTESKAIQSLRTQIANTLKREVPEFADAQTIAADSIRQEQALDAGYKLLTPSYRREDAFDVLKGSSKAERDAMAQGVRSYLDDTLANVRRTITDPNVDARQAMKVVQDLSSPANRQKLVRLLGQPKTNKLFDVIERETIALELRAAIATNSKTAIRQSIQEGVKDQTRAGIVRTLAQGEPVNATKRIIQAITGETSEAIQLRQMGLFEEIATVLTQTRGAGAQRALRTINKAITGQPIKNAEAAQVGRVLAATGGLLVHRQSQQKLMQ